MAEHSSRRGVRASFLTDEDNRRLLIFYRVIIATVDIAHGVGYLLGAPATAPSLVLMQDFAPMWVWGALLVVAGMLILVPRTRAVGMALGGFVMLVWALFSAAVLVPGAGMPATGWGWPPYAGLAALHILSTWFNSTAATRRR